MTAMDRQDVLLIERTMDNLSYLEERAVVRRQAPWEITQAVNSFLSVVAYPKERLLDPEKLKWITLDDELVRESGLPRMTSSWEYDREQPRTLGHLLRLLRNGVAHGHMDLLTKREVWSVRHSARFDEGFPEDEIAGIEIWNEDEAGRTWGAVLTVEEMRKSLQAISELALNPALHMSAPRPKTGGRKEPSRSKLRNQPTNSVVSNRDRTSVERPNSTQSPTHPLRQTDVVSEVRERASTPKFNSHDVRSISHIWDAETNSEWFSRAEFDGSPPQYSHAFVDEIVQAIAQDPWFLKKARAAMKINWYQSKAGW